MMNKKLCIVSTLCFCLFLQGCTTTAVTPVATPAIKVSPLPTLAVGFPYGMRTKTSGCVFGQPFPDRACTPGSIFTNATAALICVPGYTARVRDSSLKTKQAIDAAYNYVYDPKQPKATEVDHFIPLELGGSNDYANLWVENSVPVPAYHEKDATENFLHGEVCRAHMPLQKAQAAIVQNWQAVYATMPAACKEPYPAHGCVHTTERAGQGE